MLQRTWHVEGQSIRPDHRMVAHTGFLTHARLLGARRLSEHERARRRRSSWPSLAAGIGGWRLGFVARVFAWGGVALGLVIGIHYVPRVVTAFGGTSADDRVTVAVLFLVLVATLGQALGLGLGVIVHRYSGATARRCPAGTGFAGARDRHASACSLLVWMTIPSLATAKGWPAAHGAGFVGRRVHRHAHADADPRSSRPGAARSRMRPTPPPSVRSTTRPTPGRPPEAAIPAAVDRRCASRS